MRPGKQPAAVLGTPKARVNKRAATESALKKKQLAAKRPRPP